MDGYTSLWRKVRDHWVWKELPFSSGQAWVDLMMRAAWKKHTVTYQKQLIELRRGQHATSERQLANEWGWSRNRVKSFLQRCQKSAMLTTTKGPGYIVVTICNYNSYQTPPSQLGHERAGGRTTNGPVTLPAPGRVRATAGPGPGRVRATREEREEGNKEKKGESAPPSPPQGSPTCAPRAEGSEPMLSAAYAKSMSPGEAQSALQASKATGVPLPPDIETILLQQAKGAGHG